MANVTVAANSTEYKADLRKLDYMLKDLREMQAELLPSEGANKEDTKNMDKFQKKKLELSNKLKEVRDGIARLDEAKRTLSAGQRDPEVIKIMTENSKLLKEATQMWTDLKQILLDDENKKGKKRLEKKTLSERRKMTKLLGKEIMELGNRNSRVQSPVTATGDSDDLSKLDRDARRDQRTAKQREERRRKREKRRRGRKGEKDDDEMDDLKDPKPMSAQEQAFMDEKDAAMKEQDAMLEEIGKGLDELLEVGQDMNKNLKLQEHMLEEVGQRIDQNIEAFKTANGRLKHLLDESGGLTRWCPMIICFVLLLALVGYIISIIR